MIVFRKPMLTIALAVVATSLSGPCFAKSVDTQNIRAIETDSTDVFTVLEKLKFAETALARREYAVAKKGFEDALMHDPNLRPARRGLRRTMMAMGDLETAAKWLDEEASTDAIIIDILLGKVDNPETRLKAELQINSEPRLWTLLGTLYDQSKDYSSARQAYAMANLTGARPGLAQNNIGQSHWLEGDLDLALKSFEAAVEADPDDTLFDNNRRRVLIGLGNTHDAVQGLNAERAGLFLAKAGDQAIIDGEIRLAEFLYRKSLDLSPRHRPKVAEKLARLSHPNL
jgi:tetratricopeptide (TPR) repeat protein